jgi:uncharacterized protein YdaU (DUF1376 family)
MPGSPAFQFYAADYLADENVSVMTLEEEGAYWRAIAYCWREGSIPADDARLSRLLKGASNQTLTVVRLCFNQMPTDPTRLIHPRLEIEREKQRLWREKSSDAGKKSGKSRRDKKFSTEPTFINGLTKLEPNANQTGTLLLQSSSSSLNIKTKPTPKSAFVLPDSIPLIEWNAWLEVRKKKRASPTEHAMQLAVNKLLELQARGFSPKEVLDEAVLRNWTGIFEPTNHPNGVSNGHYETKQQRQQREFDELIKAAEAEDAKAALHRPASGYPH